LPGLYSW